MKTYVVYSAIVETLEAVLNEMQAAGARDVEVTYCGRDPRSGQAEFTVHGWRETAKACGVPGCGRPAEYLFCEGHRCASTGCPCRAQEPGGYCPICESDREQARAGRDLDREILPD